MNWFKRMVCDHDWEIVKHQIGTRIAIFTTCCSKCKVLEDRVFKVADRCEARKPVDLLGRPH